MTAARGKSLDNNKSPQALSLHKQMEMDTIKTELIAKYVKMGHSDYFLQDSERSQQYVQMRRIAMAREGNDLGIEDIVPVRSCVRSRHVLKRCSRCVPLTGELICDVRRLI